MQIPVYIITVKPNSVNILKKKYAFLNPIIKLFSPAKNYTNQSEHNKAVKKAILENTQFIINEAKNANFNHVLILQDDVFFTVKPSNILKNIELVKNFIKDNDVDVFAFGAHPNCRFTYTNEPDIVKFKYFIHWQSVIFNTNIILPKPRFPFYNANDVALAKKIQKKLLKAYGLKNPIAIQDPKFRPDEYGPSFIERYSNSFGDPVKQRKWLLIKLVVIVLVTFITIVLIDIFVLYRFKT